MLNCDYLYSTHESMIRKLNVAGSVLSDQVAEIQNVYLADSRPWIVGFSGGKDSTALLSLIYTAILHLKTEQRQKKIFVVSSDTLVETPVVVNMFRRVTNTINVQAPLDGVPMSAHTVVPQIDQTFWVNLLGKGYPAPTVRFRWCTERMKINPISQFIIEMANQNGEVVVCLGTRSNESSARAATIAKHSIKGSLLSRHATLPNAYTYLPIKNWDADDVWQYLMSAPCPWGGNNQELFDLYKGSNQGECPVVIDTGTPSCGNSRFGCWTCTVVSEDKAINGLIQAGEEWMRPLLEFRNKLHMTTLPENSRTYRNYKRRSGKVSFMRKHKNGDSDQTEKHIPGPYLIKYRKKWLKELLEIERDLAIRGHPIQLIKISELQLIRKEWLRDPNEPDWGDSVPKIYSEVYPDVRVKWNEFDAVLYTQSDAQLLKNLGAKYQVSFEMVMKLIEVEQSVNGLKRRTGIFQRLESILTKDWEDLDKIKKSHRLKLRENPYSEKLVQLEQKYKNLD